MCIRDSFYPLYPIIDKLNRDFFYAHAIPANKAYKVVNSLSLIHILGKRFVLVTNLLNDGNIFVFDRKTGKAVRKINRKGQGDVYKRQL